MKEVKCDRCGVPICYDPRMQAVLPMYTIFKKVDIQYGLMEVDLCPTCQRMLNRWLRREYPYTGDDGDESN